MLLNTVCFYLSTKMAILHTGFLGITPIKSSCFFLILTLYSHVLVLTTWLFKHPLPHSHWKHSLLYHCSLLAFCSPEGELSQLPGRDAMWPGPSKCRPCLSCYSANVWPRKTFLRPSPVFWHGGEKTYCIYEETPGSNLCSRQVGILSLYCSPFVLTLGAAVPFSPQHPHCI